MKRLLVPSLILLGAVLSAQEPPPAPAADEVNTPVAVVPLEVYDAGKILKGSKIEYAFKVKNAGRAELAILSAKAG